jgi:hypothetical protein
VRTLLPETHHVGIEIRSVDDWICLQPDPAAPPGIRFLGCKLANQLTNYPTNQLVN